MPLTPAQQAVALLLLQETDAPRAWASVVSAISIAAMDQGHDADTAALMGKFAAHSLGLKPPRTGAHGGARRGAGRKRKPDGERMVKAETFLPPKLAAEIAALGGGNLSAGLRLAAQQAVRAAACRVEIWRHDATGALFAVLCDGGRPISAAGPLSDGEADAVRSGHTPAWSDALADAINEEDEQADASTYRRVWPEEPPPEE